MQHSHATTARKCTKKRDAREQLLFANPIAFFCFRCRRRRCCLSSLLLSSRNFVTMVT